MGYARAVVRLLVHTAIALLANATGLLVAAALLDGMTLNASEFVVAVVIFTVAFALIQPFLISQLQRSDAAAKLLGGVALLATLVSLIVTALVTDGLSISGVGAWVAATVIVWLAALLATFLLPLLGLKTFVEERDAA